MEKFNDRYQAGIVLAQYLTEYANNKNAIILALPRGGVPVAYEISTALSIPLDIFIVRKLGFPGHEELAIGAIATGGTIFFNETIIAQFNLDRSSINHVVEMEQKELARRELLYRGNKTFPNLQGKVIILVDDGIATGASMHAAVEAIHKHKPASLVIAVPVAAYETCEELEPLVDKIVCPLKPIHFYAVGQWYENFSQTSDNEVIELLNKANSTLPKKR